MKDLALGVAMVLMAGCTTNHASGVASPATDGPDGKSGPTLRFFLPTDVPTNTVAPTIEIDAQGGVHAVYPSYGTGEAYYAFCPASCGGPNDMTIATLKTDGTVENAMLALDAHGRPQVLLATRSHVYYATASETAGGGGLGSMSFTTSMIFDHSGDREVTGRAFALDPQGRPRFVMHVRKAYLGVGQQSPATYLASCDARCGDPAHWKTATIAKDKILRGSNLRFDPSGVAHLATVTAVSATESAGVEAGTEVGAYLRCDSACDDEGSWKGTGLLPIFESETDAVTIKPSIALALTKSGAPRVVELGRQDGGRVLSYFECDDNCRTPAGWRATLLSNSSELGDGVDLELADDRPRLVYTLAYNIGLYSCDVADCTANDAPWDLAKVELGRDMKPDEMILYDNCTVAAWFLHSPSLALDSAGRPRVGYQARDISGGFSRPDPTRPRCVAGTDMTWSRFAMLPSAKTQ